MRWLVLGAGAIGGYFGGRLLEAGADVTFLVRPGSQQRLAQDGLRVRSPFGDMHFQHPPCLLADELKQTYDAILLACKAYDLESALDAIAPAVGRDTGVLPLLNGMGHLDALTARFGPGRALGGMCMISAALGDGGEIWHLNQLHRVAYGELDGRPTARIRAIRGDFERARFDSLLSEDVLQEMWEKWVLIATVAGATCLMRAAIGDIMRTGGRAFMLQLLDECSAIAAAHGHAIRPQARERMLAFATNPESDVTASMEKDLERGAPVEGEEIVGALIARAPAPEQLQLLPIVHLHLRAYEARRRREAAAGS